MRDSEERSAYLDSDGAPDATDPDPEGDGSPDAGEGTPDAETDGAGIHLNPYSDGDGLPDAEEGSGDAGSDGLPDHVESDIADSDEVDGIMQAEQDTERLSGLLWSQSWLSVLLPLSFVGGFALRLWFLCQRAGHAPPISSTRSRLRAIHRSHLTAAWIIVATPVICFDTHDISCSVADISCGGYACVARKQDGTAEAWGDSSYGGDASGVDLC